MHIILSPAKTMAGTSKIKAPAGTTPRFNQEAIEIALHMAQYPAEELGRMLKLSPKLMMESYHRFQNFHSAEEEPLQALLAYTGVVFKNINPKDFTEADFRFAQDHLRLISICYGLLRPLDLIKPYRMEYAPYALFALRQLFRRELMKYFRPDNPGKGFPQGLSCPAHL